MRKVSADAAANLLERRIAKLHSKATLPREDWAMFKDCEPEQLAWCLDYERCRESKRVRDLVAKWSATSEWKKLAATAKTPEAMFQAASIFLLTGKGSLKRAKEMRLEVSLHLFTFADYFPAAAFVSIPPATRAGRIAPVNGITSGLPQVCEWTPKDLQDNLGEHLRLRHEYYPPNYPQSFTVCRISWAYSNSAIVGAFKQWLEAMRDKHPEFAPQDTRDELRAQLKKLGALRLLRQMTWEQAADFTQTVLRQPLYSEQPAWSRAESEAKKELEGFEARLFPRSI